MLSPLSSPWSAQEIFGVATWPVVLFMLPYTVLFVLRRHRRPIKGRMIGLSLAMDVATILWAFVLCWKMVFWRDWPCLLNIWDSHIVANFLAVLYMARTWLLLIEHNKTDLKNAIATASSPAQMDAYQPQLGWRPSQIAAYVTYIVSYASPRFVVSVVLVVLTATIIPVFIFTNRAAPPDDFWAWEGCYTTPAAALLAAELVMYAAAATAFAFKIRSREDDNYGIKNELRITGYTLAIYVVPWVLFNLVPKLRALNDTVFRITTALALFLITLLFVFRTVLPVHDSYRIRRIYKRRVSHEIDQFTELRFLLANPSGFAAFASFLAKEFSNENILFWDEARTFRHYVEREMSPMSEIMKSAQAIFDKYIAEGAIAQVNLTHGIVRALMARMSKLREAAALPGVSPTDSALKHQAGQLYAEAEKHIFNVLVQDPYPRFCRSAEYAAVRELVQDIRIEFVSLGPDAATQRLSSMYSLLPPPVHFVDRPSLAVDSDLEMHSSTSFLLLSPSSGAPPARDAEVEP